MNLTHPLFDAPWAEALGWTLLHSLWQGLFIAAIVALISSLVGPKAARLRYLSGVIGMGVMLCVAGFTFAQVYPQNASHRPTEDGRLAHEPFAPLAQATDVTENGPREGEPSESSHEVSAQVWSEQVSQWLTPYTPWLAALWLAGFGLLFLRWLSSYAYTQSLRYRNAQTMGYAWQAEVNRLARRLGLTRTVWLIESHLIDSPLTLGHFKPVILLPMGLLSGLSGEQVEAILMHELAHIRRHDYLINLLVSLVEVLFFYHPGIWWMGRELRQAREHCCDDLAVAICGNAMQYAHTLAELAEATVPSHMALGLSSPRKPLLTRVKRLLAPHTLPQSRGRAVVASLLLLLSLGGFWLTPAQAEASREPFGEKALTEPLGIRGPWFAQHGFRTNDQPALSESKAPQSTTVEGEPWDMVPLSRLASRAMTLTLGRVDSPPPAPATPLPPLPEKPVVPPVPPIPPKPPLPAIEWNGDTAAYQASWQEYERSMEEWRNTWVESYEQAWGAYAKEMQAWAEAYVAQADHGVDWETTMAEPMSQLEVAMQAQAEEMRQQEVERARHEAERARHDAERARHEAQRAQREIERAQGEVQREMEQAKRERQQARRALEAERRRFDAERRRLRDDAARLREGEGALKEAAIDDGIIQAEDEALVVKLDEDKLRINGKRIPGDQYDKYLRILNKMGIKGSGQIQFKSD